MKIKLPFIWKPFLLQADRETYLHKQAWLAIESSVTYNEVSKAGLSAFGKDCKILYHLSLKHVNTIYLIRPEST
jgi:hypothetical protein